MSGGSVTLSLEGERKGRAAPTVGPYLVVVLECNRPLGAPSRHLLRDLKQVEIGRGSERGFERHAGEASLSIAVPDRWMSSKHARVVNTFGHWSIEDADSKNGTLHNGKPVTRAELGDGDLIEAGRTLFLFRSAAEVPLGSPDDVTFSDDLPEPELFTLSPSFAATIEQLRCVAESPLSVSLTGETGSGKEVVAKALHRLSKREGAYVALNCGAIPASLVESELFGYVRGAFSGADSDRAGLVRSADGGTLFLDEIADLPASSQAALLRVLQEREVVPVGATKAIGVDVRVLAATHADLRQMIIDGGFRRDLFARLAGFEFALPALRDRREDIGLLFRNLLARRFDLSEHPGISIDAARLLLNHDWPLNVRELDNTLAAALAFAGQKRLEVEHLPPAVREGKKAPSAKRSKPRAPLSSEERALRDDLVERLNSNGGNVSATARVLGKDRKQIQRWLKRFGIDAEQFRTGSSSSS